MMKKITILGATGSIGRSTVDIVRQHPEKFRIIGLSTNTNIEELQKLNIEFKPKKTVVANYEAYKNCVSSEHCKLLSGKEGLEEIASDPESDIVVVGIVGFAGLLPIMAAAKAGKRILLANKEALVCAGNIIVKICVDSGANIIPIDSEHNAIYQCLGNNYKCFVKPKNITKIILTASGGPFRTWKKKAIFNASVEQAIAHPNWKMGKKISVDSATMINKALEIIEAHWLFNLKSNEIDVVIHPESVVHSMIEFSDKAILAQLGQPDMRVPIAFGLNWPERLEMDLESIDWRQIKSLNFEPLDLNKFPAVELARYVLSHGGSHGAVMNAANEIAVDSFLFGKICFGKIIEIVKKTLEKFSGVASKTVTSLEELESLDDSVRSHCKNLILKESK